MRACLNGECLVINITDHMAGRAQMNLPRANCAFDKTANRDQLAGNLAGHAGFFTNRDSVRAQITFQNASI